MSDVWVPSGHSVLDPSSLLLISDPSANVSSPSHLASDSDSEVYCDSVDQFGQEEVRAHWKHCPRSSSSSSSSSSPSRLVLSSPELRTELLPGWPGGRGEPGFSSCRGVAGRAGGAAGSSAGHHVRRRRWRERRGVALEAEVQREWIQQLCVQTRERWVPGRAAPVALLRLITSTL